MTFCLGGAEPVNRVSESPVVLETVTAVFGGVFGDGRTRSGAVAGRASWPGGAGVAVAVVVGGGGSARGWRERGEASEGGGEVLGPGPVAVEVQDRVAGVEGEAAGDVQ